MKTTNILIWVKDSQIILVLGIISFFNGCGRNVNEIYAKKRGGGISFEETKFNAGAIIEGENAHHDFKLRNNFSFPIKVKDIFNNCQCAEIKLFIHGKWFNMDLIKGNVWIKPREEGLLRLGLNSNGHFGRAVAQSVLYFTNEKGEIFREKITFSTIIKPYFVIEPDPIEIGKINPHEGAEFTFTVMTPYAKKWFITKIISKPSCVRSIEKKKNENNGFVLYYIKGKISKELNPGPVGGELVIGTNINKRIEVPIKGYVPYPFKSFPDNYLSFGKILKKKGKTRAIKLVSQDKMNELSVLGVYIKETNIPKKFYEILKKELIPGKEWMVSIRVKRGCPCGLIRGKIKVRLQYKNLKETEYFFSGFIKE